MDGGGSQPDLCVLIELDRAEASLGPVRDALDLSEGCSPLGVRIVLTGRRREALGDLSARFGVETLAARSRTFSRLGLPAYAASVLAWIGRLLRLRPDVLHLNYASWGPSSACAAHLLRIPVVARGVAEYYSANPSNRWIERYLVNCREQAGALLDSPLAARVVVAGSLLAREVLAGGEELASPLPVPRRDQPLFLYLGRILPEKGLDVLLEAFGRMRSGADLLIVGGDWPANGFPAVLKEMRVSLGLEDRVYLESHRSDALAVLRRCDVLVLPSRSDTRPRTILEAMFAGKPVIASAVGGIPGVVEDGLTGILVPPGDPAALARALDSLAASAAARTRLGEAARAKAWRDLHPDRVARRYAEVYREVARR